MTQAGQQTSGSQQVSAASREVLAPLSEVPMRFAEALSASMREVAMGSPAVVQRTVLADSLKAHQASERAPAVFPGVQARPVELSPRAIELAAQTRVAPQSMELPAQPVATAPSKEQLARWLNVPSCSPGWSQASTEAPRRFGQASTWPARNRKSALSDRQSRRRARRRRIQRTL